MSSFASPARGPSPFGGNLGLGQIDPNGIMSGGMNPSGSQPFQPTGAPTMGAMGPRPQGGMQPMGAPQSQGMGGGFGGGFGMNPAVMAQASAIGNQFSEQLNKSVLPGIGSNAQLAGGFGGSRQGVAEGNAISGMSQSLGNSLAGLYGNAYNTDMSASLQNKSLDQNFYLGNQGQNQNFYTAQRGQDLQQQGLGADMFNKGFAGNLGIGQGTFNVGQQFLNAPAQAGQTFGSTLSPFAGGGTTTTGTTQQNSNPWAGALGGAIAGSQLAGGWSNTFGNQPVTKP